MNIPKTIESSVIDALRSYGVGEKTLLRSWRNLRKDEKWDELTDRSFPCIMVIASPPKADQNTATACQCEVAIMVYTINADDQSHDTLNTIEQAVQECLDTLYAGHRGNDSTGLYASFVASVESGCAVNVGGLFIGDSIPPDEDGAGHLMVGMNLVVSYSRSDFN